ncbi:MAG: 23S rRNA (uracil(1939)-C(5))-methyltransferase RlmD [Deltaproteobacteria bacterium]|nr:23S rRNA (uracil(1939)-C(5))-methyltransferase RlmD [Deltaproteobacteria bacterium]
MTLRKGHRVELTIHNMAYGGKGVARLNGFVIFVKGAIPGDRILAQVVKKKKDHAEAGIAEVMTPSPDRIEPPCPYSPYCGGCQWQHVRYETQLFYKKNEVQEALKHIGGLDNVIVHDTLPSDKQFAYRNKMEFSFSDRRWFLPQEMDGRHLEAGFALGLHVPGTYSKVIDVDTCLLQEERGNAILREVKTYARGSGAPVYGLKSHKGFWRFLMLRHSSAFDEWMVNLVTSEERPEVVRPLADALGRRFPGIKTVVNNITSRKASIAIGEREIVLSGEGFIKDRIGPFTFEISANSFFQTNSLGAEKLYQKVVDYAQLKTTDKVLDLYSGTGTIPIFLAEKARIVTGMEMSRSAVDNARKNVEANGMDNCRFICGDIRKEIHALDFRPDALIIDPPRAGMHKEVLAQVLALGPRRVVYVSCNPATLARDLGLMAQDYDVVEIQPIDMFPHTYHIEAVARLRLRKSPPL